MSPANVLERRQRVQLLGSDCPGRHASQKGQRAVFGLLPHRKRARSMRRYQSGPVASHFSRPSTGAEETDIKPRTATRTSEFLVEAVVPRDGGPGLRCAVRDLSLTGARMELDRERAQPVTAADISDEFLAYFPQQKTEVACRVIWRDGRHFGVKFLDQPHPSPGPSC
jgi:hypothetical protein